MNTKELQIRIKEIRQKIGWSQTRLATEIFIEENDVDNEDELQRFQEKLKKELKRETTKPERLQRYLDIIALHPDVEKANIIVTNSYNSGQLSPELEKGMLDISNLIYEKIQHSTDKD